MRRERAVLLVVSGILLGMSGISVAQQAGPCRADVERLCKGVPPADLRDCMRKHASELSPACKARLSDAKERVQEHAAALKQACQGDIDKYCSKTEPGKFGVARCLHDHEAQLSPGCTAAMSARPARRRGAPAGGAPAQPPQ